MEKNDRNEFDVTAECLNGVIGTLSCGCTMSEDECWTAEDLMRRCQVYINEFNKRFMVVEYDYPEADISKDQL